jgi:hypothetical protein
VMVRMEESGAGRTNRWTWAGSPGFSLTVWAARGASRRQRIITRGRMATRHAARVALIQPSHHRRTETALDSWSHTSTSLQPSPPVIMPCHPSRRLEARHSHLRGRHCDRQGPRFEHRNSAFSHSELFRFESTCDKHGHLSFPTRMTSMFKA